jgi:Leucine-rich repeat (LRR) protein
MFGQYRKLCTRFSVCIMLMAQLMTTAYADTSHVKVASNNSLAAVGICDSVTDVSQQECDALLIVYSEMGGQNWTNQAGWLTDTSVCSWFGITCDGIPSVRQINLPFNNMIGSIPAELGSFTNLKLLYLSSNHLVGGIPAELGNLTNLIQIELNHNQLSGSIPIELANMPILNTLYLHHNLLTGSIPAELGTMNNLLRLDLNHNQLSGSIPIELANMSALTSLYLHNNQLVGSIPAELGNMTILQNLVLYSNQLTGSIPAELGNMTALRNLALRDNQLSGSVPAELGNLANLQSLGLNINQLTGSIPKELGSLNNMYTLFLGSNQLSGSIPKELGSLSSLQALRLTSNKLTGNIPVELGNLTDLESGESVELGWNALYASDGILDSFLDTKSGLDWSTTQTIAPYNVAVERQGGGSAMMSWDPIEYSGDTGRYRVFFSDTPGGPYIDAGVTSDKAEGSLTVDGLSPDLAYHFVVQTETDAHANNTNDVISEVSTEVSSAPEYIYESTDFASDLNFLTDPLDSTVFTELDFNSGFDPTQDAVVSVVDSNTVTPGKLTISSQDATWQNEADDGVFLGLKVYGDFIAEMTVTSMDALAGHSVGLMVRVPAENNLDAAGPGQDYVTLGVSGSINQIEWSSTDENKTTKLGESQGSAAALNRINGALENEVHFRIQRNGSVLRAYYRIGFESTWIELEGSPLDRPDINTLELEVGIYQTSEAQATAVVDDFSVRSERIFHSSFE